MMPDVLRMVGIPFGLAEACAEVATWTEAAKGGAISFLREHRERLLWEPRPRPVVTDDSPTCLRVDARGGSWLELGPSILGFFVARASEARAVAGSVENIFGELFLACLEEQAARRGYFFKALLAGPPAGARPPAGRGADYEVRCEARVPRRGPSLDAERYRARLMSGLDVAEEDFLYFRQLHEMLRVPTSERSRSHAG